MRREVLWLGLAGLLSLFSELALSSTTYSGRLDDAANSALVYSDLGAPQFTDAASIANNVALYIFNLGSAANVSFSSHSFAVGGIDPYFTLFSGLLGGGATVVGSNYDQAFATGGDFTFALPLAAGSYTIALGTFANMSFAENLGSGSLDDGFITLGGEDSLGSSYYELVVDAGTVTSIPEPETGSLIVLGLAALAACTRRKRALQTRSAL